jgi:ATP-binding cassette, subfamily B, multidrug efflux pump
VSDQQKSGDSASGNVFDVAILRRLYDFTRPYRGRFFTLVGVILLGAILAPLMPLLIRQTIDNQIAVADYRGLSIMLAIMVGVLVVQAFVQFANAYLSGWLGQHVIRDIRVQVYEKVLSLRLKFFDNTSRVLSPISKRWPTCSAKAWRPLPATFCN